MQTEDDRPIAREPWQRLLRERYDAPPEVTDARIRAAARRALAPRPARWWLPASLAASFLLAVMLVQWQYGDDRAPAYVSESDVGTVPSDLPPEQGANAADAAAPVEQRIDSRQVPSAAPPVLPPATSALPQPAREREMPLTGVTAAETRRDQMKSEPLRATPALDAGKPAALTEAAEARDPGEWYEAIQALRAAGRGEEADAELAQLEAAWPGWLEKNHPRQR